MVGEESKARPCVGNLKTYARSASWSDRSPRTPNDPKPRWNSKARACLPPLQPLSISRPSFDEWPNPGSDDVGVWLTSPAPGARPRSLTPRESSSGEAQYHPRDKIAFFNKDCSKIVDYIYLGSDVIAKNREVLAQNGITHVLNCVGFVCPEYFKDDLAYKTLWLHDRPSEDITSILYDVFDYFEDVREQGGRVFVHCCQGVSRSTSLVIAYLMWKEGQSFEDAFQHVKAARGVTNPNMGFACQLLQCQKRVHALPASPSSMLRMYRMAPHSPYDPFHLVPKKLSEPGVQGLDSRGAFLVHVPSAIYIWLGKHCISMMEENARVAAFQVIRYEKVQGPAVIIREGKEPIEFWEALGVHGGLADVNGCGDLRKVHEYDQDFEMFQRAFSGGVVPPVPLSGNGTETCLPARETGWGRLRRKFATGVMKEFITSSKLSSIVPETNGCWVSTKPSLTSLASFCRRQSHSASPSLSPATSDHSSSFISSPSSAWSDLSYHSTQPSPSGAEEAFSPSYALRILSTGGSPSLAERQGSALPCWNKLSSVDEASQVPETLDRSGSFSVSDSEDEIMKDIEEDSCEMNKDDDNDDNNYEIYHHTLPHEIADRVAELAKLAIYQWPSMHKVDTCCDAPDSSSVYIIHISDDITGSTDVLFIWVGREVTWAPGINDQLVSIGSSSNNSKDAPPPPPPHVWLKKTISHHFLSQRGLATNCHIQMVKEGEEPEQLLNYLPRFSFQKPVDSRVR